MKTQPTVLFDAFRKKQSGPKRSVLALVVARRRKGSRFSYIAENGGVSSTAPGMKNPVSAVSPEDAISRDGAGEEDQKVTNKEKVRTKIKELEQERKLLYDLFKQSVA